MLSAQDEDIGLDTNLLELLDGVLGGLGLHFTSRSDIGDVGQVDAQAVLPELPLELSYAFEEGEGFDIADGTTDLGDDEVVLLLEAKKLDVALDLVGDMGDDLYGLAEVVALTLLADDVLVDTPSGDVVGS